MNKRHAILQFFTDGLLGLSIVALNYGLLWLLNIMSPERILVPDQALPRIIVKIVNFIVSQLLHTVTPLFMYCSPLILASVFISSAINGRFIKSGMMRKDWAKPILKMLSVSWLVTVAVTLWMLFFTVSVIMLMSRNDIGVFQMFSDVFSGLIRSPFTEFFMFISGGTMGILLGFTAAYLSAIIFNPQKRWTGVFISMIASICMVISTTAFGLWFAAVVYPRWDFGSVLLRGVI